MNPENPEKAPNAELLEAPKSELIRSDLNLERWSLFAVKPYRGVRVLKRGTEEVQVGLPGSTACLTTAEMLIMVELLAIWGEAVSRGADPYGTLGHSLSRLADGMYKGRDGEKRKNRRGGWWRQWFDRHLNNMLTVPIVWIHAYREKDGTRLTKESFTLLDKAEIFKRDDPGNPEKKYFELSKIRIHPRIIDSLVSGNSKPIRKDILGSLRGRIAPLLYRKMDSILSYHTTFEKSGPDICHEFLIDGKRTREVIARVRAACKQLVGREISKEGRIVACDVIATKAGSWKVVARRGPRISKKAAPVKLAAINPSPAKLPAIALARSPEDQEDRALWAIFKNLTDEERATVRQIQSELLASYPSKYASMKMTRRVALLDSIKRFRDDLTAEAITSRARSGFSVVREEPRNPYMSEGERTFRTRLAAARLAAVLRLLSTMAPGG